MREPGGRVRRRGPVHVPVTPDASTARQWARDELARPVYHQHASLLTRALDWLRDLFSGVDRHAAGGSVWAAALVVLAGVLVGLALWIGGPVRRNRRAASAPGAVLASDDVRTAAQLRAAADAASARGEHGLAVTERFRAVVRGLEERTVLDERPGRTADAAASLAADRVPDCARDLVAAGRLFDDVAYGGRGAGPDDDARLRELDARVRAARPLAPAGPHVVGGAGTTSGHR